MQEVLILGSMTLCGLIPFALVTRWVERGKNGLALTVLSILGAVLTILLYATNHDFGLDPIRAISWALLFALPALVGGCAGALLGWLIRRRRDKKIQK